MRGYVILTLFILCIGSIGLVSAVNDKLQANFGTDGYEIKYPNIFTFKQNSYFDFNFHVFNLTNGVPINNATVQCNFHLYNQTGDHIYTTDRVPHDPVTEHGVVNEWVVRMNGANFSNTGQYSYIIQCNDSVRGGFVNVPILITKTGVELTTQEAIIYSILLLGIILILIGSFYFALTIPYSNQENNMGEVIKITKLKYFKIFLIGLTYALFLWFLNLLVGLSDNFITLTMYYGFISFIFNSMMNLSIPFIIILLIWSGISIIVDMKVEKRMKELWGTKL